MQNVARQIASAVKLSLTKTNQAKKQRNGLCCVLTNPEKPGISSVPDTLLQKKIFYKTYHRY